MDTPINKWICCYHIFWGALVYGTSDIHWVYILGSILVLARPGAIFVQTILQMTGRTTEYAFLVLIGGFTYLFAVLIGIGIGVHEPQYYATAWVIGILFSFIYGMYLIKEVIFSRLFKGNRVHELKKNVVIGSKLMLASYSALGIIGAAQWIVKIFWPIETFARISLSLSLTNVLLPFITAVSLVIFPVLKRNLSNQREIYNKLNSILSLVLPFSFGAYFIITAFVELWLPNYTESLKYLAILFPIVAIQAKYEILANTFLKTNRKEGEILKLNMVSFMLSLGFSLIFGWWSHEILMMLIAIVIVLIIRLILATHIVEKNIFNKTSYFKMNFLFILFTVAFVIQSYIFGRALIIQVIFYIAMMGVYLFSFRSIVLKFCLYARTKISTLKRKVIS